MRIRGIASEIFAKIDAAVIAESCDRLASRGVERVNKVHNADDDALVGAGGDGPFSELQ